MKHSCFRSLATGLVLMGASQSALKADPFTLENDELILGIQAAGGTGVNQNVFVNLGKTTDYLNGGNLGPKGNISATLEETYGSDWFERADLWFGVAGNRDHLHPQITQPPGAGQDPTQTWYVSKAAAGPGGAGAWPAWGASTLGAGGTNFFGLKRIFQSPSSGETLTLNTDGMAVLDRNDHPVAWNNSWTKWNPVPGAGFGIWNGGIQNNFGKTGDSVSVDIQRLTAGQPGTYVFTVTIGSDGNITAERAEGPLPLPAFVDSDGDGLSDFLEDLLVDYGFDKNVSQTALVSQFLASQGFYTADSIQDLRAANQVLIEAQGANVNLSLPVLKSGTLEDDWIPAGNLQLTIPKDGDKQFYRIEIPGAQ